jgi:hypothetical protein
MIELACLYYPGIFQYLIYMPEFSAVFNDKAATIALVKKYQNDVIKRLGKSLIQL